MSIGEDLAEARRQAGLTVSQVSQLTRIREAIIRDIERGDYAACGGDFYARGHIRAIAHAVGADPGPLIREYDAVQRASQPISAAEAFRPAMPITMHERRRLNWTAALGLALVAAVGVVAYHVVSGSGHPPGAAAAGLHRVAHRRAPHPAPAASPVSGPYADKVVVHLVAIEDCWVEFTSPGGGYLLQAYVVAGTSKTWTFSHAVDMRLGNPGGIHLTVDGRHPLPPGSGQPITLSLGLNGKISS